jgi:hypothetical protein
MHREHPERNLTVYADPAGQGVARRWLHACELFGLPGIECGHPVAHQQDEWQTADAPRHCRKEIEATVRTGKGAAVSEELRVSGAAVFSTPLSSTVSDGPREKLFAVATVAALATGASLLLLSFVLAIAAGAGDINRWMLIGGAFLGVLAAAAGSIRFLNWKMTGRQVLELVGEGVGLKCELKGRQISQWSCHHRAVRSVGAWRTGAGGWGVFIRTAEDRVVFGGRLPEGDARRVCRALRERLPL